MFLVLVLNPDVKLYWKLSIYRKILDNWFHGFQVLSMYDELILLSDGLSNPDWYL